MIWGRLREKDQVGPDNDWGEFAMGSPHIHFVKQNRYLAV